MCCDGRVSRDDIDIPGLRAVAEQLAAEAAAFVRRRRREVFGVGRPGDDDAAVRSKSTRTDPVTLVDTETEALLRERLSVQRPGEQVLGEEGGGERSAAGTGAVTWVLDPIDGTVNFVYAIPVYAVSVAAQVDGVSVAGAVADVPAGRLYSAGLGLGAEVVDVDGQRHALRCNAIDDVALALVGTGFAYSPRMRAAQAAVLAALLPQVRDVRRIGSAALDLCMVAAGRMDAHYEHGLNVWDWAAGALVAAEAGARVHLPRGGAMGAVVVSAPGVADALLSRLQALGALEGLPDVD